VSEQDDWKNRYLKEARDWESTEQLLRRTVGRLAIAADGVSPGLDAVLARIQGHAQDADNRALEKDLDELSQQIKRLDATAADAAEPSADVDKQPPSERDYCESLIDKLELPTEQIESIARFRSRLGDLPPDHCLAELALQISRILKERPSGGGERELLLTLVDEVAVTHPGLGALETLRESLQRSEDSDWYRVLGRIIGEIRGLIQRINGDRQALEELMLKVSDELGEISDVLFDERNGLEEGRGEVLTLHDIVQDGVKRIQTHIDADADIERLKSGVNHALEAIRRGVTEFVDKDYRRFSASRVRNEELQQRIQDMEREARELREQLSENREQLMRDALTGARSRFAYDELLAQELGRYRRYREPFSLAVFDIDFFKRVNDEFGHGAGDNALKLVVTIMDERLRETDYLFRIGGEEFVVLLPRTPLEQAATLAETLRAAVGDSGSHHDDKPVLITLSAGVTEVREDDTAETVFERADDALYRAKQAGRDQLLTLA
jgi:diguanylate cyclase